MATSPDSFEGSGLRLENPDFVIGQPIGALVSCVAGKPIVITPPPEHVPNPDFGTDAQITRILNAWESFDFTNILKIWDKYAAHPFTMVLTKEWIGAVDRKMIEDGIKTNAFKGRRAEYPSYKKRKVKLNNVQIAYIGGTQAVATYSFEEQFKNDKVIVTNALTVLMMNEKGEWRIGLYSKHI